MLWSTQSSLPSWAETKHITEQGTARKTAPSRKREQETANNGQNTLYSKIMKPRRKIQKEVAALGKRLPKIGEGKRFMLSANSFEQCQARRSSKALLPAPSVTPMLGKRGIGRHACGCTALIGEREESPHYPKASIQRKWILPLLRPQGYRQVIAYGSLAKAYYKVGNLPEYAHLRSGATLIAPTGKFWNHRPIERYSFHLLWLVAGRQFNGNCRNH